MGLSCECDFDDDGGDYFYDKPGNYSLLCTSKRKRCCSCNELIDINAITVAFTSYRLARNDIEDRIHGGEVPMATKYMCELCGDFYFNLEALGFCLQIGESMKDLMTEYAEYYAPVKIDNSNE